MKPGALRALRDAALIVGMIFALARGLGLIWPVGYDAHAYWAADMGTLYPPSQLGTQDFFGYSPAFGQALEPLRALPFTAFLGLWTGLLVAALTFLAGPLTLLLVLLRPVWLELVVGNINLLIGTAIVLGFRFPAMWTFVLLTKVTPGIGVLWFARRREWRSLLVALSATAVIVAASFVLAPGLWFDWFNVLVASASAANDSEAPIRIPLLFRLPVAMLLVWWGAGGNHRWVLPVAALMAMPALWESTFSILVAVIPLVDREDVRQRIASLRSRLHPVARSPSASSAPDQRGIEIVQPSMGGGNWASAKRDRGLRPPSRAPE